MAPRIRKERVVKMESLRCECWEHRIAVPMGGLWENGMDGGKVSSNRIVSDAVREHWKESSAGHQRQRSGWNCGRK